MRDVIAQQLTFCQHVSGDAEFFTVAGCPSGNCFTAGFNSLTNSIYVRCAWYIIWNSLTGERLAQLQKKYAEPKEYVDVSMLDKRAQSLRAFRAMEYFDQFVRLIVYGDDLVASLSNQEVFGVRIPVVFNNETLQEAFASVGLTYTDAKKSANILPYENISDVTFLKRGWYPHPNRSGVWLAPLELSMVLDTPNWVHKSRDDIEAAKINCQCAVRELYHYPQLFDKYVNKIRQFWNDFGVECPLPEWDDLDLLFQGELSEGSLGSEWFKALTQINLFK